jgi:hypothetical protein
MGRSSKIIIINPTAQRNKLSNQTGTVLIAPCTTVAVLHYNIFFLFVMYQET